MWWCGCGFLVFLKFQGLWMRLSSFFSLKLSWVCYLLNYGFYGEWLLAILFVDWKEQNKVWRILFLSPTFSTILHPFLKRLGCPLVLFFFISSQGSSSGLPGFQLLGLSPLSARAPKFIPVTWDPPPQGWVKVNTDGSFRDSSRAGFGGILETLRVFLWVLSLLRMLLLVLLMQKSWQWLKLFRWRGFVVGLVWLETDSALVVQYFKSFHVVLWRLEQLSASIMRFASSCVLYFSGRKFSSRLHCQLWSF